MKKEHKVWWENLADLYDEWAENPPMLGLFKHEQYTCTAFDWEHSVDFAFMNHDPRVYKFFDNLLMVAGYKDIIQPAGSVTDPDRATKREAYCQDIADTIREYIK